MKGGTIADMASPKQHGVVQSPALALSQGESSSIERILYDYFANFRGQLVKHRHFLTRLTSLSELPEFAGQDKKRLAEFLGAHNDLLFWRAMLLDLVTTSLEKEELEKLSWLTIDILHLPATRTFAVAEALYQRRWKQAKDPFAYVCTVANTIYRRDHETRSVGDDLKFVADYYYGCAKYQPRQMTEVEVLLDLHQALRRLRLPDDVMEMYRAAYHGVAPSTLAGDLGWTLTRLRTARRGYDRAKARMKAALTGYDYPLGED
jgi:hypothetical protein